MKRTQTYDTAVGVKSIEIRIKYSPIAYAQRLPFADSRRTSRRRQYAPAEAVNRADAAVWNTRRRHNGEWTLLVDGRLCTGSSIMRRLWWCCGVVCRDESAEFEPNINPMREVLHLA